MCRVPEEKPSQSDGLIMDFEGRLYVSSVGDNAVYTLDAQGNLEQGDLGLGGTGGSSSSSNLTVADFDLLLQDNATMVWPASLAIDDSGTYLWVLAAGGWPPEAPEASLHRLQILKASYLYDDV